MQPRFPFVDNEQCETLSGVSAGCGSPGRGEEPGGLPSLQVSALDAILYLYRDQAPHSFGFFSQSRGIIQSISGKASHFQHDSSLFQDYHAPLSFFASHSVSYPAGALGVGALSAPHPALLPLSPTPHVSPPCPACRATLRFLWPLLLDSGLRKACLPEIPP